VVAVVLAAAAVLAGCLPAAPSTGRATPVRRVLVLGDSLTFGLFSTTPQVQDQLGRRMAARRVQLIVDGFPAETPIDVFPGHPMWSARLRLAIATQDPDMVVIQTTLFPNAGDPARQASYRAAVRELFDIAQSRGAHVYIVSHQVQGRAVDRSETLTAEAIQADVAAGRGISTIPLDWWIAHCRRPFVADGWHLSAAGQECHANAITAAVDQLKRVVG
jgi:lysophospholipase L1-like esterase